MDTIWLLARLILAAVFAVAGVGKLMDIPGSIKATQGFGIPERLARPIGTLLPFLELLAAILLIPVSTALAGAVLALALLTAFLAGMVNSLRKGEAPDCHCFGQIHSEPVGPRTIIRNAVLAALAIVVLFGGTSPGHSLLGWLDGESGAVKVLAAGVALLILAVAAEGWLIVHLLGQNGRMLIKMDEIAARPMAVAAQPPVPAQAAVEPVKVAPAFSGTGLIGEKVTLDSLRAHKKPVLVIFSDPGCGPCKTLQPEIAKWQTDYADRLTVAMVTRGSIDEAREKVKPQGIKNVLIEKDRSISKAYDVPGTPAAVLIDIDGNLGSKVVAGSDAIRTLVGTASNPAPTNGSGAKTPAPRPAGLAIGTDAPEFTLPNKDGVDVSTIDLHGKESVLLFWNPGCGFCKRMQPDLIEWAEAGGGSVELVTVTSGTHDDAEKMTFADSVLLDQRFATGRLFGASGTPSAIKVGADGKIASKLAVGGPSIMEMIKAPAQVENS